MGINLNVIYGVMIPFIGTSLGAFCVYFMKKDLSKGVERMLSGFAAGVMVAASIWSLLIPAMEESSDMGRLAFIPAVIGFWIGIGFLLLMDHVIPHMHAATNEVEGPKSSLSRTTMLVLAVTLHNIPEGMSIGVPLIAGGMAKWKAVLLTALSGAPTLVGGALGAYLGSGGDALVAISLALAAGAMLYVTYCEILPQVILLNQERGPAVFTIMGIILGLLMVHAL